MGAGEKGYFLLWPHFRSHNQFPLAFGSDMMRSAETRRVPRRERKGQSMKHPVCLGGDVVIGDADSVRAAYELAADYFRLFRMHALGYRLGRAQSGEWRDDDGVLHCGYIVDLYGMGEEEIDAGIDAEADRSRA